MFRQRLRVFFAKEGPLRFISHHDLMRLWERALRRADLPLKMSEGFNPRPQISFPAALALGIESEVEIVEVELTEWISTARTKSKLERELPEGIGIREVKSVWHGDKAEIVGTEYSVRVAGLPGDLEGRLKAFMDSREAVVERKTKSGVKSINVREYVRRVHLDHGAVRFDLAVTSAGSVRPQEVLEAIFRQSCDALPPLEIRRVGLRLAPPS